MPGPISSLIRRSTDPTYDGYYIDGGSGFGWLMGLLGTVSGEPVDAGTAEAISAWHNGVRLISETMGKLPMHVYRRDGAARIQDNDHPLAGIFHVRVNGEMPSSAWREIVTEHQIVYGDHFSEIEWNASRTVVKGLWPLDPTRMRVRRGNRAGTNKTGKFYYYHEPLTNREAELNDWQVLQLPGYGYDGMRARSVLSAARNALAMANAMERYGGSFFKNGGVPSGTLNTDAELGDEGYERVKRDWYEAHGGLGNALRIAVLEQGMKYEKIGVPPEDMQFLGSRKFQVAEIARFLNIPVHKLKELDRSTLNNIEHQGIEYVVDCIQPYVTRHETWINFKLFAARWPDHFVKLNLAGLMRGDMKSRYEAYKTGRYGGWLTANMILAAEDMNPAPPEVGDVYWMPSNMFPADKAYEPVTPVSAQPPTRAAAAGEKRSKPARLAAARARLRLRRRYRILIRQVVERIVRREVVDVRRRMEKSQRAQSELEAWLEEYYGADHREFIERNYLPVLQAYEEDVLELARSEAPEPEGTATGLDEKAGEMIRHYAAGYARRHAESSLGQIQQLMRDNPETAEDAVTERLDEWEETRADKIADDESVRVGEAVAAFAFLFVGHQLIWAAVGDDPCPFCQELDGRSIGREGYFVKYGDELSPEGADGPMQVYEPKTHPPLHGGCVCTVTPG